MEYRAHYTRRYHHIAPCTQLMAKVYKLNVCQCPRVPKRMSSEYNPSYCTMQCQLVACLSQCL